MLSLFNPWVILGIILAILGSFGSGYYKGEHDENTRQQIEIAKLNQQARETEQRMGEVAQTYAQTLRKANNVAKVKENKLRTDIASGERKLFIPVKASCPVSTPADSTASSGNTETRAELDAGTAQALVDLTSRGDTAIRSLNACIDQYNQMRTMK
jgi:type II secretory pathway pseudopilin PulG